MGTSSRISENRCYARDQPFDRFGGETAHQQTTQPGVIRGIGEDHLVRSDTDPGGQLTALLVCIVRDRAHVPAGGKPRVAKQGKAVVISRACQYIQAERNISRYGSRKNSGEPTAGMITLRL
jgi:hypothetical protein